MLLWLNRGLWNGCCSGLTSGTHHRSDSRKGCRNHCQNLESLLVAHHRFGLHTPVIRSIPQCHIHSRPPSVLIWWYSFSTSYCWCVVTPIPIIKTGMIGFPGHPITLPGLHTFFGAANLPSCSLLVSLCWLTNSKRVNPKKGSSVDLTIPSGSWWTACRTALSTRGSFGNHSHVSSPEQ